MRNVEVKNVDGVKVYIYTCPICGKPITSLYLNQLRHNARQHKIIFHRRRNKNRVK